MRAKIEKINVQEIFELSMVQKGILYHYLKEAKENLYNVQLSFSVAGKLDIEILMEAFTTVQRKNDALRSIFRWEEVTKPIQIVLKECPVDFSYHDLSQYGRNEIASAVAELSTRDQQDRFDLTKLPIKVKVIKTAPEAFVLNITNHHILYDGWSNGILLKELFYCYNELCGGRKPKISSKPGYKELHLSTQKNIDVSARNVFWQGYLKDFEPQLHFADAAANQASYQEVKKLQVHTPIEAVDEFAKEHKVTKASIIYAAYGILLQKYSGLSDVVFGSTVSNRNPSIRGIDQTIGNFINTIPLRIQSGESTTNFQLVTQVNYDLIQRHSFHNTSLYEVKQILELQPNDSLFDSVVGIENYPLNQELTNSIEGIDLKLEAVYENTNVSLVIQVFFKERLEIEFSYKRSLIDDGHIDTIAKCLIKIIQQIVSNPSEKASSISFLSQEDENKIVCEFNATAVEFPRDQTVVDLFEHQVAIAPQHEAITCDNLKITYGDLNRRANQLANVLIGKGITNSDIVGLMTEPSIEMMVGILGILKAGAAYMPVNPEFPKSRIEAMCAEARCKMLLTQKQLLGRINGEILQLDLDGQELQDGAATNPLVRIQPDNLLYVIFTSGSTGTPKGVMIKHRNLVNYAYWLKDFIKLSEVSKTVLATSFAFDLGYTSMFPSILFGGQLHLLSKTTYQSAENFLEYIRDHKITYLKLTPSLYSTLVDNLEFEKIKSLKTLVLGGEKIRTEDIEKTFKVSPDIQIVNHYGPTETTIGSVARHIRLEDLTSFRKHPSIGKPINNARCYILDRHNHLVPIGAKGELCIAGAGLGKGYLANKELNSSKFIQDPFAPGELMYKTGDLARWLPDGNIQFLGRIDQQVKIRGYRIEIEEIEKHVSGHHLVQQVAVIEKKGGADSFLVCYYASKDEIKELRDYLVQRLPDYMIPSYFIHLQSMPLTPNGKLDKKSLPDVAAQSTDEFVKASNNVEQVLTDIWKDVLGYENISTTKNFFEIGGDSLKLIKVSSRIIQRLKFKIQVTDLFEYPTIKALAKFISSGNTRNEHDNGKAKVEPSVKAERIDHPDYSDSDIAIIGMAGRFPGARNVNEFWENLKSGVDSITRNIEEQSANPTIFAKGILEECDLFDAAFFSYTPEEANLMDPQMRIFHECTWEALEDAGYDPYQYEGAIGLYAGASLNPYYSPNVLVNHRENWMDEWQEYIYSTKDFLCPRVSYKLNLRGPSVNISTACSTSLVALDIACNDLRNGKCSIAISGGISLTFHDSEGYKYKKDMILSPDSYCRAFDENAAGTVGGNGVGIVVLKRLKDAISDGDNIHAIIKGSARNNDGIQKVGFTSPSIEGQANVIRAALRENSINADTISYVEAHGTGTLLGDPIEIRGLETAFASDKKQFCAIGSVKTNIGHLNAASGVAGLIKTVLSLKHKQIPPSLHFKAPNPKINFADSPFYVNTELKEWKNDKHPLRAGVSSFGIGGTNAHVVLEEAPVQKASSESRPFQLIVFSGKTQTALERNIENFKTYLQTNESLPLADIAYTQNRGRTPFDYREFIVCENRSEAIDQLTEKDRTGTSAPVRHVGGQSIVFMFPGQGSQYINMCYDLYRSEAYFRKEVDGCFEIITDRWGKDLKSILFPGNSSEPNNDLYSTEFTQPVLFVIEYALARLLLRFGIVPDVVIGHSIGEYAAACISGVFSLEDALTLVVRRGEIMQKAPKGSMLNIAVSEEALRPLLDQQEGLSLAAINSAQSCVVSGSDEAVQRFHDIIIKEGYEGKLLHSSRAFHSSMMDSVLEEFDQVVRTVKISPQQIPLVSNLSGRLADDQQISEPRYWVNQLRQTVRFGEGIQTVMANEKVLFIEVGPGNVLSSFVRSNKLKGAQHKVVNLVRHLNQKSDDLKFFLKGVGELWKTGVSLNWNGYYDNESRRKVSLPTYPFEKTRYPVKSQASQALEQYPERSLVRGKDVSKWFYIPTWKISPIIPGSLSGDRSCNILFTDDCGVGEVLLQKFIQGEEQIICVKKGDSFREVSSMLYQVDPASEEDFAELFGNLSAKGLIPDRVIHAWTIEQNAGSAFSAEAFLASCTSNLYSLASIVKATHQQGSLLGKQIILITNELQNITGHERTSLASALPVGLLKVVSQEYPTVSTSHIDIALSEGWNVDKVYKEIMHKEAGKTVAFRNSRRWVQIFDKIDIKQLADPQLSLRKTGVYLITGGLGSLGFSFARHLSNKVNARLILLGRTILPAKNDWNNYFLEPSADEDIKVKITRILELERQGGEVFYMPCDISDKSEVESIITQAEKRFGQINGVFHAAGIIRGVSKNPISLLRKEDYEYQFKAKILGLHVLKNLMEGRELDFCIVTSSLSTILGGVGFAAYASANTYIDYFVNSCRENSTSGNWISVNFDGLNLDKAGGEGINSEEITEVFERILTMTSLPQVAVSVADLNLRIDQWVKTGTEESKTDETGLADLKDLENEIYADTDDGSVTPYEKRLIRIWQSFFGNAEIDANSDFFELGGDSLKALKMINLIHKGFHIELSVKEFFENSTVRHLGDYLDKLTGNESGAGSGGTAKFVSIPKAPTKAYYPLSSVQKRLLFMYELDRDSVAYNMPLILRLDGTVDRARLTNSFNKLIKRHESLRTYFKVINEEPCQVIVEEPEFAVEDHRSGGDEGQIIQSFVRPFNLSKAPLLRAGFIETASGEHILMVDMHHIITDGVSKGILMQDFMALYNGEELPGLQLQYKDFAVWQQQQQQEREVSKQKDFWISNFSEYPEVLDLPIDFPRPAVKSFAGSLVSFELDDEATSKLKTIAEAEGATMFMVLLSIFNVFLSKISNQEDIVIGTITAGRRHPDLEKIIGMFVNTLALRNFPRGSLSFREFLSEVRLRTLACFDNQSYQYETLLEDLKVPRDPSRNPLFDAAFVLQNYERSALTIPGLKLTQIDEEHTASKFDITLTAFERDNTILLQFEYAVDLFKTETIERFMAYFQKLASAVTNNVDVRISDINIVTEQETHQLLYTINGAKTDYPADKTLIQLFEEQVRRTADNIALVCNEEEVTYAELNDRANQLVYYLRSKGVERGSVVALQADRSVETIVNIIAILKAGGIYVPVDTAQQQARIRHILNESNALFLLTGSGDNMSYGEHITVIAARDGKAYSTPKENMPVRSSSADVAYIMYTSGSTGKPKGVMITHQSVVNLIHAHKHRFNMTEEDRVLLFSPIYFDASVEQLWIALLNGAAAVLVSKEVIMDSNLFSNYIIDHKVTQLYATPSFLEKIELKGQGSLKRVVSGGEDCKPHLVEKFSREYPFYIEYGPTEATVTSVVYRVFGKWEGTNNIPIGRPIDNTSVYILGKNLELLPRGSKGELCIGGKGLAVGYVNNELLTREKFVDNPFVPGERIYRSGDLARWTQDGNVEFLGRMDEQVKIRGFRIELAEIESQLATHSKVKGVIIVVKEKESDKHLVAYYTADEEIEVTEIRSFLSDKLPDYMIPSYYVHLEVMPVTPNGKVDRKALPEPVMKAGGKYAAPINQAQKDLVKIWADVLHLDASVIGVNSNFFDLGGNSLKMISMINRINKEFNVEISAAKMFELPVISSIARFLDSTEEIQSDKVELNMQESLERMNETVDLLRNRN